MDGRACCIGAAAGACCEMYVCELMAVCDTTRALVLRQFSVYTFL